MTQLLLVLGRVLYRGGDRTRTVWAVLHDLLIRALAAGSRLALDRPI